MKAKIVQNFDLMIPAGGNAPRLLMEWMAETFKSTSTPITVKQGETHRPGSATDEIGGLPVFVVSFHGLAPSYAANARNYINANL